MTEQEARVIAEPAIKGIVDCMATNDYESIEKYAEFKKLTVEEFKECAEEFLAYNGLTHYDRYGVPCNFKPQYEYNQLEIFIYNNGSGFGVDYGLTTESELNDLTLMVDFRFTDTGVKAFIDDIHVL